MQQDIMPYIASDHASPREPASRVVFRTPELRKIILSSVDRATLAGMMRLEKDAVAGVAEVLYRRIHQSVVSKISRDSPRREIYCNSVLEIDRSPLHDPSQSVTKTEPILLVPETLRDALEITRLAFPRLRALWYQYPADFRDDSYHVCLTKDKTTVLLQSHVTIHIGDPLPTIAALPITPKQIPGMVILHSLFLEFDYGIAGNPTAVVPAARIEQWKNWLFHFKGPELPDPRITGISFSNKLRRKASICSADIISFLSHHRTNNGLPLQHLSLPITSGQTVERLDEIVHFTQSSLRTLHVDSGTKTPNWPEFITAADKAFPNLDVLAIAEAQGPSFTGPLSGMANLREFAYLPLRESKAPLQPFALARHLYRLGTDDCVFTAPGYHDKTLFAQLSKLIKRLKSSNPSCRFLHKIGCKDLDLWTPSDIFMADFDVSNGSGMRRLGWTKCSIHNLDLAASQDQLADMAARQADVIEGFRQMFTGALADLEGKDGDLRGQGEAIQARFGSVEDVEKRKKELEEAFAGMRAVIGDMEVSVKDASDYAVRWLNQQKGGKGKRQGP